MNRAPRPAVARRLAPACLPTAWAAACAAAWASAWATAEAAVPQTLCRLHPLLPSAAPSAAFERGLAADGSRLVATFVDGDTADVELFERAGPTWRSRGVVGAATPQNRNEQFGHVLDLEGPSLIVAAPFAPGPTGSGVLRPFDETPAGWVARPEITTRHPFAQVFGASFDRDGGVVVAHSWFASFASFDNRLHVFEELATGAFAEVQVIDDPAPAPPAQGFSTFGEALAVEGPWLLAGGSNVPEGRAWAWLRGSAGYTLHQELVPPGQRTGAYGRALAASGDLVAVADSELPAPPGQLGVGAVHVFGFVPAAGSFVHLDTLYAPSQLATVRFGEALALEARSLAVAFHVPTVTSFPPLEGLALFDGVGLPQPTVATVTQNAFSPGSAVGRTLRFADGELVATDRSEIVGNAQLALGDLGRFTRGPLGLRVCRGAANSTGAAATLTVEPCVTRLGFDVALAGLPPGEAGVLLLGLGATSAPVGQGVLCIGQAQRVARFASSAQGQASAHVDHVAAGHLAGEVVRVQAFYRDGAAMNLTEARELELVD